MRKFKLSFSLRHHHVGEEIAPGGHRWPVDRRVCGQRIRRRRHWQPGHLLTLRHPHHQDGRHPIHDSAGRQVSHPVHDSAGRQVSHPVHDSAGCQVRLSVRVEWCLRKEKTGARKVVPKGYKTPNSKISLWNVAFNLASGNLDDRMQKYGSNLRVTLPRRIEESSRRREGRVSSRQQIV